MAHPSHCLARLHLEGLIEGPLLHTLSPFIHAAEKEIQPKVGDYLTTGILICETDPLKFIATLLVALNHNIPTFLGNPHWRSNEWNQVFALANPKIFGQLPKNSEIPAERKSATCFHGYLMIPTGGTTGQLRFAIHTWNNLFTSAKATQSFLNLPTLNAYNTLPTYHVSGLMPFIRALVTGGNIVYCDYKEWLKGNFPTHLLPNPILSIIPTQLEELIRLPSAISFLRNFHTIFVGGSPSSPTILNTAKDHQLPISLVYGMTETASMVCAIPPSEFLLGHYTTATSLPHATLTSDDNQIIHIHSPSLFYGYYPHLLNFNSGWKTNDKGTIDSTGRITILGRADRILITGGEKVDPQEVEAAILSTGFAKKAVVTSIPDPKWGQKIVCAYIPAYPHLTNDLITQLKSLVTHYKLPKSWLQLEEIPTHPTGKIDYPKIQQLFNNIRAI